MYIGISGDGGADVDSDRGGINQLYLPYAFRFDAFHMVRQPVAGYVGLQSGDEAFQDKGRLAGAGNSGYDREPSFGNVRFKRLDGVYRACGKVDAPIFKNLSGRNCLPYADIGLPGEVWAYLGRTVACDFLYCPCCNDISSCRTGSRAHFYQMICFGQDLRVMVHKYYGIAVGYQVFHHSGESDHIGGVQTYRRLVQHIEDACGPVSYCTGQLHPLPFSGGERGCCAVEAKISDTEIQQAA